LTSRFRVSSMVFAENRSTMRTGIGLQAALCIAVVMLLLPAPRAIAEDAAPAATGAEVAKPSVAELAIPMVAQKTADNVRDTATREAMCLMIESAARANGLPLEFFARLLWQEARVQSHAVGPAACRGLRPQQGTGDVCARDETAERRHRRPGSELAELGDAHPGQPPVLPGADRRRHAARRRRSLQPHPPRRRRLLCAAKHECQGL